MAAPTSSVDHGTSRIPPAIIARLGRAARALGTPLGAVLFAFFLGAIVVTVTGGNAILAYQSLICGGIGMLCTGTVYPSLQISETIVYTTPLILAGAAVAISFRAGLFNIGAEGQIIMGAIASTIVGIKVASLPGILLIPLVLLAGAIAGAFWGGIVGVLKAYTGAHEVVTTIMLNYIALYILEYLLVGGPLQMKGSSSVSGSIVPGAQLPFLIPQNGTFLGLPGSVYRANTGIILALLGAVVFWFLIRRTAFGYELRAMGQSQRAARYAGISVRRTLIMTMLVSGLFAGLAGAVVVSGLRHNLTFNTYQADTTGFDAITVALLGQNTAIGVVLSALLLGALHVGGQFMQSNANVSANLVDILQALILFSIAANFLRSLKFRFPALRQARPDASGVAPDLYVTETDLEPPGPSTVSTAPPGEVDTRSTGEKL
jgi:simple sugar transport system permease protein